MLKKRLSQVDFFASLVNFYIANYFTNFQMTASGTFIIKRTFCEREKDHKFDNFKTVPC